MTGLVGLSTASNAIMASGLDGMALTNEECIEHQLQETICV